MQVEKDLKTLAKEAKKRLKSGFWSKYKSEVAKKKEVAKEKGMSESKVIDYYQIKSGAITASKKLIDEDEKFFLKVKEILDTKGQVGNIISLLIEHDVFDQMPFDKRQKYLLDLSNRYLEALDRYNSEKRICN